VTPFFAEFIHDEFIQADTIVIPKSKILDLLILDMEKLEIRMNRITGNDEKLLITKCMEQLENEIPLCDIELTNEEREVLKTADPYSLTPVVTIEGNEDINSIISLSLEKANYMFFYTSGPTESHAWLIKESSDIVTCAAKIHSDLARGFIKGIVVNFEDYMSCHSFNSCKSKGLAKMVDRDYIVQSNEVIEIMFNV
jgi:ribosome-binding ATPase YchF (GTP1/OBG family)